MKFFPLQTKRLFEIGPYILLFLGIYISRLPFLSNGYGLDADGWRIIRSGIVMQKTGQYACSRKPCYPLPEITAWLMTPTTDFFFNGMAALLCALGGVAFAATLKRVGVRNYLLPALALAFVPVIYVNSTNAMDYVWALSFLLLSMHQLFSNRMLLAGVFFGMAVASRITTVTLSLPLAAVIFYLYRDNRHFWKPLLTFTLSSATVAIAFFIPVLMKFGMDFLDINDQTGISTQSMTTRMTTEIWGGLGIIALVVLVIATLILGIKSNATRRRWFGFSKEQKAWFFLCVFSSIMFSAMFIRFPLEAGYMVPVIPFVIGIFALVLPTKITVVSWILILISPFWMDITVSKKPNCGTVTIPVPFSSKRQFCIRGTGPVLDRHYDRKSFHDKANKAVKAINDIAKKTTGKMVVVAGVRQQMLSVGWRGRIERNVRLEYTLNRQQLNNYLKQKAPIYVLHSAGKYNWRKKRVRLKKHIAGVIPF